MKGIERTPRSPGLRDGRDTPQSFNGRQGRGPPEVEGAWDRRSRPGSGVRGLHGFLGSGSCGRPHLAHKAAAALSSPESFVFSIRASWVGVVRAPRARGALPSWGAGASRDYGDYKGAPAEPRLVAAKAAPDFPPLTRVAPGYQQH